MPMPARSDRRCTVCTIQASSAVRGWVINCRPVVHLAICLLISSEMMDPVKPMNSENTISDP